MRKILKQIWRFEKELQYRKVIYVVHTRSWKEYAKNEEQTCTMYLAEMFDLVSISEEKDDNMRGKKAYTKMVVNQK